MSFRTITFQVTAFDTQEDLYCETSSDINAMTVTKYAAFTVESVISLKIGHKMPY
ncbi:MAG: hypothetical protein ACLPY5_16090 [Candidatus Bathyarchaeia archaeon]